MYSNCNESNNPNSNPNIDTATKEETKITTTSKTKRQSIKRSIHRLFKRSDPKLFRAIQENRWNDALHYLNTDTDTDILARYQIKGTSILHCACKRPRTPSEIISKLMTLYPNAIYKEDNWGCTPLHYAVCRSEDDVVLEMLKRFPTSASCRDKEGDTPLNWALGILNKIQASSTIFSTPYIRESFKYLFLATKMRSTNIIRAIIEADPSQEEVLYASCKDLLFSMISFQNWELRKELAVIDSTSSSLIHHDNNDGSSSNKETNENYMDSTTNTMAESTNSSESVIADIYDRSIFLLNAALNHTIGTASSNNKKDPFLAVHASLRVRDCPWSIFKLCLNAHPSEVFQYDKEGNLPIHILSSSQPFSDGDLYLCLNCNCKPTTKCYQFPFEENVDNQTYEWVQRMTDIPINNPIMFGLTNVVTFRVIIYAYFATVLGGLLVLCHDCHVNETNRDVVTPDDCDSMILVDKLPTALKDMLQYYPHLASIPNKKSRLPLHLAVQACTFQSLSSVTSIMSLFYAAPQALSTRDINTHLFPFMTLAISLEGRGTTSNITMTELSPSKKMEETEKNKREKELLQFSTVYNLLMLDPSVLRAVVME